MRGSLRLRHVRSCPAFSGDRGKDLRACRCSPGVQGRVAGVTRSLGRLPAGWRTADLIQFERELADLRTLVVEGRTPPVRRVVTLREFAGPWFEQIARQVEVGRMSPYTYNNYEGRWRNHLEPFFGSLPLPAIDHAAIAKYMRDRQDAGLQESTVKHHLAVLCEMLTDAMGEGLIERNPLRTPKRARHRGGGRHDAIDLQPKRKLPRFLEPAEARALLAATPDEYRDLVLCALTTGFRRCELLGLRWEWIDFRARRIDLRGQLFWRLTGNRREREATLRVCKYDSEREVPRYDGLARLLASRQASSGWVFTDPSTGEPWEYSRPAYVFLRKAYEDARLRRPGVMWHALRHTYASVLAAGGVKRHELEKLMGHASQGTTGIYTHLFRESYETVHAALDAVYGSTHSPVRLVGLAPVASEVGRTEPGRF
jgi:integrase